MRQSRSSNRKKSCSGTKKNTAKTKRAIQDKDKRKKKKKITPKPVAKPKETDATDYDENGREILQPFVNNDERTEESEHTTHRPPRRSSSSSKGRSHVFQQHAVTREGHNPFGNQHNPFSKGTKNPFNPHSK